ncbi:hypothetical protein V5O48_011605 [Marasmius crinis-equi]|uniref:Uncharacterized protein n=1 Tax=Marasmius crinis-equi TaxID=585013 RepID=A0ABR3F545_9AGAR
MSTRGTSNTSNSELLPNTTGVNVNGTTHNHVGQDSHNTATNHYDHSSITYNNCTFNGTSPTIPGHTGTAHDTNKPNETAEHPVTRNSASFNAGTAVWAVLSLCVLTGGRWTFHIIRHIVRRQLFAQFNRNRLRGSDGLDGAVAGVVPVEVENSGVEPRNIGDTAGSGHEG